MSTASHRNAPSGSDRHPAQWLALGIGAAYLLIGVAGFLVTGFDNWVGQEGSLLLGFEVNGLHNVVHIAIGALGLALGTSLAGARGYGWLLFAVYGLTFVYGLFVAGSGSDANFLALNGADNGLHAISALAGLAMALWPARDRDTGARAASTDGRTIDLTEDQRHDAAAGPRR